MTTRHTPSNPALPWYNDVAMQTRTVSARTGLSLLKGILHRLGFGRFETGGGLLYNCEWYRAYNLNRADRTPEAGNPYDPHTPKPHSYNRGAVGIQITRQGDRWTVKTWRQLRNPDPR